MANKFGENSLDKDGYVVYHRKSTMAYREQDRYRQETRIMGYFKDISFDDDTERRMIDTVSHTLKIMAENERRKELALLQSITGKNISIQDEMDFVAHFNELTMGAKQYNNAVQRINIALKNGRKQGKGTDGLAPALGSLFLPKFQKIFGNTVNAYIYRYITNKNKKGGIEEKDLEEMENKISNEIFPSCIEKTMEQILTTNNLSKIEDKFGGKISDEEYAKAYEEIYAVFKNNSYLRQLFVDTMKTTFNMDSIKKIITGHKDILKEGKFSKKRGVGIKGGTWARKALNIKKSTDTKGQSVGVAGGKFYEFFSALISASLSQEITLKDGGTVIREGRNFIGDMSKMDGAEIISMDIGVNGGELLQILEEYEKIIGNSENLTQTHDALVEFNKFNEKLQNLSNTFIIYRSNKMYGIDNIGKQSGFTAGTYNLTHLEAIMESNTNSGLNNFGRMNIHKFMRVICNILDGAILDNYTFIINDRLQSYVCESIASMLFDDWEQVGEDIKNETGPKSIHIMALEGVDVPISVFLFSAAESFAELYREDELSNIAKARIVGKPKILYPSPKSYEIGKGVNGEEQPLVNEAWEKQRIDAMDRIKVEVRFYKNFKDSILKRLKFI
mgnify:CR=1 FL=1